MKLFASSVTCLVLLLHVLIGQWSVMAQDVTPAANEDANSKDVLAGRAVRSEEVPFELQPYRVLVSVAFADAPGLDAQVRRDTLLEIVQLSDRLLGEMWTVTAEENAWLIPATLENLSRTNATALPERWTSDEQDKSFLVIVEQAGAEFRISGREWDHIGQILGQPKTQVVLHRRELSNVLFRLLRELFRPLMTIDRVVDKTVSCTVKAGALTPSDPDFSQLRLDLYWQPFQRFRNSKNEVERLEVIPWTLLQISEISGTSPAHGNARVITGLRSPLPTRRRSRVDLYARAIQPENPVTEFRLVSRKNPTRPLVGVVVELKPKRDEPPVRRLLTDRNGIIRLPQGEHHTVEWLHVRSGEKKLALLPIIPGMESRLTAELPDDSIRLRVEGELSILQSNLTDTVAQRAVLMARIRKLAAADDRKAVRELQKELKQLPTISTYLQELATIRLPAVQEAQAVQDRSTAAQIERVCNEASKLIQRFLDDEKMKSFEAEMTELEIEKKNAPKVKAEMPS